MTTLFKFFKKITEYIAIKLDYTKIMHWIKLGSLLITLYL